MEPAILLKPMPQIEEWFLAKVEETPLPIVDLLAVLKAVGADPALREAATSWAELLHDRLKKDRDLVRGVELTELRAAWLAGKDEGVIRAQCDRWLSDLFSREPTGRNFIPGSGFREYVPVSTCFRRMRLLMNLKPGAFCVHKSWGPGTVKRLDDFYSKVVVDFAGHPNHEMSYTFVAESLETPGDDHLLAIQYRDRARLEAMVKEEPAEVVRIALKSFGDMPMARLQQTLCPAVLPTTAWKPFWEAARKGLLAAGDCEIPAKKLEPLRLIDRAATPADRWMARFREERRLEELAVMFEELLQDRERPVADAAFDALLRDKMDGVLLGAAGSKEEQVVRTILAAQKLGITPAKADMPLLRGRWMQEKSFKKLLNELPVRLVRPFILMITQDLTDGLDKLITLIPELNLSPMAEAIDLLKEKGLEDPLRESLRGVADRRHENIRFLCWMARNLNQVRAWKLVPLEQLPFRIIEMLHGVFMYENLRAANALKLMLNDKEWLSRTVGSMDEVLRNDFLRLVREPDSAMYYDAQALLGRLIVLFPELAAAFATEVTTGRPTSGFTSWRSYTRRQRQLERLTNIDIPKNSREIEVARSYGDLRENHEYKSAKEMQGILLRRQDEMKHDLQTVRGSDFVNFSTDTAGMGVEVELEFPDGGKIVYSILGEWDQDPNLNIISCQSGLGKRLEGLKAGDPLLVPDAEGKDQPARLAAIRPLSPAVQEWIREMNAP
jgi:transcription elongation GreA/GreB family factor